VGRRPRLTQFDQAGRVTIATLVARLFSALIRSRTRHSQDPRFNSRGASEVAEERLRSAARARLATLGQRDMQQLDRGRMSAYGMLVALQRYSGSLK